MLDGALAGLSLLEDRPNYRHSMPTKVIEYMAHGLPVITTPLPLAADLVERSGCGIVVPFDDAEATAAAPHRAGPRPRATRGPGTGRARVRPRAPRLERHRPRLRAPRHRPRPAPPRRGRALPRDPAPTHTPPPTSSTDSTGDPHVRGRNRRHRPRLHRPADRRRPRHPRRRRSSASTSTRRPSRRSTRGEVPFVEPDLGDRRQRRRRRWAG